MPFKKIEKSVMKPTTSKPPKANADIEEVNNLTLLTFSRPIIAPGTKKASRRFLVRGATENGEEQNQITAFSNRMSSRFFELRTLYQNSHAGTRPIVNFENLYQWSNTGFNFQENSDFTSISTENRVVSCQGRISELLERGICGKCYAVTTNTSIQHCGQRVSIIPAFQLDDIQMPDNCPIKLSVNDEDIFMVLAGSIDELSCEAHVGQTIYVEYEAAHITAVRKLSDNEFAVDTARDNMNFFNPSINNQ